MRKLVMEEWRSPLPNHQHQFPQDSKRYSNYGIMCCLVISEIEKMPMEKAP
ncbi:hypothetical protein [Calothrix sp. 336/3]|uniref:hypothetical protein n=1 Tax=Calothrix sp. 336/3 TaxID=1337936 RepID=UPI00143B978A|nr:hypothetical protein [Calothrix sp. 336/3]